MSLSDRDWDRNDEQDNYALYQRSVFATPETSSFTCPLMHEGLNICYRCLIFDSTSAGQLITTCSSVSRETDVVIFKKNG